MKFIDNTRPKQCPWGQMLSCENVATGIWRVDTGSHGGYYISVERKDAMPKPLREYRNFVQRKDGGTGQWYEEDIDWCIVCLAYPDDFTRKLGLAERPEVLRMARLICERAIKDPAVLDWLRTAFEVTT